MDCGVLAFDLKAVSYQYTLLYNKGKSNILIYHVKTLKCLDKRPRRISLKNQKTNLPVINKSKHPVLDQYWFCEILHHVRRKTTIYQPLLSPVHDSYGSVMRYEALFTYKQIRLTVMKELAVHTGCRK